MNFKSFKKFLVNYIVKTTVDSVKDQYGGVSIQVTEKSIKGYFSKSTTTSRDSSGTPVTESDGIFFTYPETLLNTGDIIDDNMQVVDFDKHHTHNEYRVKFLDHYGDNENDGKGY